MKRKSQLVDSFSKGNRSCLCSWTLGLGCMAFRNSILSLFGWGWLLWARLTGQPTGRFPMRSPTVAVLKDRVAHPFLINSAILVVSLTGLVLWGARARGRCSIWEHFQIPLLKIYTINMDLTEQILLSITQPPVAQNVLGMPIPVFRGTAPWSIGDFPEHDWFSLCAGSLTLLMISFNSLCR